MIDRQGYRTLLRELKDGKEPTLWLLNARVLDTPSGSYKPVQNVQVVGNKILKLCTGAPPAAATAYDCKGLFLVPGEHCPGSLQGILELLQPICTHSCALSSAKHTVTCDPGCGTSSLRSAINNVTSFVRTGLCDAHIHCTASTANLASLLSQPESFVTAHAAVELEQTLARGFTTVRDAGASAPVGFP